MKRFLSKVVSLFLCVVMIFGSAPLDGLTNIHPGSFLSDCFDKFTKFIDGISLPKIKADAADSFEAGQVITFGEYPQSIVSDATVISKLSKVSPDASGVYRVDKDRYYKVNSNYYKFEPIQWKVLSVNGAELFVIADKVLAGQAYDTTGAAVTWENSTLNYWLNTFFLDTAFNSSQRRAIHTSNYFGYDKISLLTYPDCLKSEYGFNSNNQYDDPARRAYSTAFAQTQGVRSGYCDWIVRETTATNQIHYALNSDGCIGECHSLASSTTIMGIRPAVVFNSKSSDFNAEVIKENENSYYILLNEKDFRGFEFVKLENKKVTVTGISYIKNNDGEIDKSTYNVAFSNEYESDNKGFLEIPKTDMGDADAIKIEYKNNSGAFTDLCDYIVDVNVLKSPSSVTDYKKDKNFSYSSVYLVSDKYPQKPCISTIWYRNNSSSSGWKDASKDGIKIPVISEEIFDIKIYVVNNGNTIDDIVLSQSGAHKLESSKVNGSVLFSDNEFTYVYFKDVKLTDYFTYGYDLIGYCKFGNSISPTFNTKIEFSDVTDADVIKSLSNLKSIKITPEQSFKVPSEIPGLDGAKLNLNMGSIPVNVSLDGNCVKISAGIKEGYDLNDGEWDEFKGLVKGWQDQVSKAGGNITSLKKGLGAKKKFCTKSNAKWGLSDNNKIDFSFYLYAEGSVVNGQLVMKEFGAIFTAEYKKTFWSHPVYIGWVPVSISFELDFKASFSAQLSRVNLDSDIPFELDFTLVFNPSVTLGIAAGVPKVATIGIYGEANFNWTINFTEKYHEAYLEGKVYAQLKTFLFDSGKWELLNSDKLYWWQKSWTDSKKSVPRAITEEKTADKLENLSDIYYDTNNYQLSDRDYLTDMQWKGTSTKTLRKAKAGSLSVSGYDIKTLQTSIYSDSRQQLAIVDGKIVLVWIMDDTTRSSENRTVLVYSIFDESNDSWSTPLPVCDDGTADFYPCLQSDGNRMFVTWNNINKVLGQEVELRDYLNSSDICVAEFDSESNSFVNVESITSDNDMDILPTVVVNGKNVGIVWIKNTDNSVFSTEGISSFNYSSLNNGEWTTPTCIKNDVGSVSSFDVTIDNGNTYIAYAYDKDCDLLDSSDSEISLIKYDGVNTTSIQLTDDDLFDSSPRFALFEGNVHLLWSVQGGIKEINNLANLGIVDTVSSLVGVSDSFIITNSGNKQYLIWPVADNGNVSFNCSVYNNNIWSDPILIGNTNGKVLNPTAVVDENGKIIVAYNNVNQTEVTELINDKEVTYLEDTSTDLCLLKVNQAANISIDKETLYIDESEVLPGNNIDISFDVVNNGIVAVSEIELVVDGERVSNHLVNLRPGDYTQLTFSYTFPDTIVKNTNVSVEVSPSETDDFDLSDNTASITYGHQDLDIVDVKQEDFGQYYNILATISNIGSVKSDAFTVNVYKDYVGGVLLHSEDIVGIGENEYCLVNFTVEKSDIARVEDDIARYYVEVVGTNESDSPNNIEMIAFIPEEETGIYAAVHEHKINGKHVEIFGSVSNGNLEDASVYVLIEVKNAGHLVGVDLIKSSIYSSEVLSIEDTIPVNAVYDNVDISFKILETGTGAIDIVIPDGVEEILDNQFANCDDIASVSIPSSVVTIGANSFSGCNSISEVVLPENIQFLGEGAFANCEALTSVMISDKINSIGEGAFNNSPNVEFNIFGNPDVAYDFAEQNGIDYKLTYGNYSDGQAINYEIVDGHAEITGVVRTDNGSIVIPDKVGKYDVTSIQRSAFVDSEDLITLKIGNNVTNIGVNAFSGCSNLESVDFGDTSSVDIGNFAFEGCESLSEVNLSSSNHIGSYAFSNCTSLESVTFGDDLDNISTTAFDGCESLTDLSFSEDNENYCIIDGIVYNSDVSELVLCLPSKQGNVAVPDSVKKIDSFAFNDCESITSVTLGNVLEIIGDYSFYGCSSLGKIILPDSLTQIGTYAFAMCDSLYAVDLGNGLGSVTASAFANCSDLKDLTVGESIASINKSAFVGCNKLKKLNFNAVNCSNFTSSTAPFKKIFSSSESLEVIVGNNVKSIPDYLLYPSSTDTNYVSPITEITLGSSVVSIGKYAFYNCSSVQSIIIPDTVKSIGDYAFWNCMKASILTLGNNVEFIGKYAFYYCKSVESITIPDSTTEIGDYAFSNCIETQEITIGKNVKSIGYRAFEYSNKAGNLYYNAVNVEDSSRNETFYNIGSSVSASNFIVSEGVEIIPANLLNAGGNTYITSVVIADSVTEIGEYAFSDCRRISSLYIGSGTETIGNYAFYCCSGLVDLNIPDSVTAVGDYCFNNCTSIKSIEFGDSLEIIGDYAFYNDYNLKEIEFPDSLLSIGDYSFANCSSLETVIIDDNLSDIGACAFSGCSKLRNVVDKDGDIQMEYDDGVMFNSDRTELISCVTSKSGKYVVPDTVVTIDERAFYNCNKLTEVVLPNSLVTICDYAFCGCSSMTSLTLPKSLRTIGNYAFQDCTKITEITVPDSVRYLGDYAFSNCNSVNTLTLGNRLIKIGDNAFYNLYKITEINIPNAVTSIGASAFNGCTAVLSITIGESVKTIGNNAFYGCTALTSIEYNAVNASDFSENYNNNYRFFNAGKNGTGINVVFGDKVERIPAYLFYPYNNNTSYKPKIVSVDIGEKVESIGICAFYNAKELVSVTGMESVRTIEKSAFYGCSNLIRVELNETDGEGSIGECAFFDNIKLTSILVPDSITSIGNYAFYNCNSATSITIGDGVKAIGESAFRNCSAATALTIGENVEVIDNNAFYDCTALTSIEYNAVNASDFSENYNSNYRFYNVGKNGTGINVVFGDKVERIPAYLFYPYNNNTSYKPKIVSVDIGEKVESIGMCAFYNAKELVSVTGMESIRTIEKSAFYGCASLTTLAFGDELENIEDNAFASCSSLEFVIIPVNKQNLGNSLFLNSTKVTVIGEGNSDIYEYCSYNSVKFIPFGLSIQSLPAKTSYQIGEELDCTGLSLLYADKNGVSLNESYSVYGYDSTEEGYQKITVLSGLHSVDFYVAVGNVDTLTVSYYADEDDVTPIATYDVGINESVPTPSNVSKFGYMFDGWDNDIPVMMPGESLVFVAKWKESVINLGETISLEIISGQLTYVKFIPEITGKYVFTSLANVDTYGYLYNEHLTQLTYDDDSGNGNNFKITYDLTAGNTYYFGARYYSSSNSGRFDVTLICGHTYGEYIVDKDASCSEMGLQHRVCLICGNVSSESIPLTSHNYGDYIIDSEPTCTEFGTKHRICTECKYVDSTDIPYAPHTYTEYVYSTEDKLFTCQCAICSKSFEVEDCKLIEINERVSMPSDGEIYALVFMPEESGDYVFTVVTPESVGCELLDSSLNSIMYSDSDGTENCVTLSYSFTAGEIYVIYVFNYSMETEEFEVTIGCNHTYGEYITDREPTCSEPGQHHRICSQCNYEQISLIDTVPHTYGEYVYNSEKQCLESNCSVCGSVKTMDGCYSIELNENLEVKLNENTRYVVFVPEQSGYYSFSSASDRDTFCYLYDSSLNLITSNDDGGNDYNFDIRYSFIAGQTYIFEVRFLNLSESGSFVVTIGCAHQFGDYITDVEATCSSSGSRHRVCEICGYVECDEVEGGHNYSSLAYDSESGLLIVICSRCGEPDDQEMSATQVFLGETVSGSVDDYYTIFAYIPETSGEQSATLSSNYYIDVVLFDSEMNLLKSSYESNTSVILNYQFEAGKLYVFAVEMSGAGSDATVDVTLECNHNYSTYTTDTEATCESNGEGHGVCDYCGEENSFTIPAFGHSFVIDVDTAIGTVRQYCTNCDISESIENIYCVNLSSEEEYNFTPNMEDTSIGIVMYSDYSGRYTITLDKESNTEDLPSMISLSTFGEIEYTYKSLGNDSAECTFECKIGEYVLVAIKTVSENSSVHMDIRHCHQSDSLIADTQSTCTTPGFGHGVCKICGVNFTTEIPAHHDYYLEYNTESNCCIIGCKLCENSDYGNEIPAEQIMPGQEVRFNGVSFYYYECTVPGTYTIETKNVDDIEMVVVYPDGSLSEYYRDSSLVPTLYLKQGTRLLLAAEQMNSDTYSNIAIRLKKVDSEVKRYNSSVKFADSSIEVKSGNNIYLYPTIKNPQYYDVVWEVNNDNVSVEEVCDGCIVTAKSVGKVKVTVKLVDENGKVVAKDSINVKVKYNAAYTKEYHLSDNERFVQLFAFISKLFAGMLKQIAFRIF